MNAITSDDFLLAVLAEPDRAAPWCSAVEACCTAAVRFEDLTQALVRAAQAPRTLFLLDSSLAHGETAFWIGLLRACDLGPIVWVESEPGLAADRLPNELALAPEHLPDDGSGWPEWAQACWNRSAGHSRGGPDPRSKAAAIDDAFIADSLHEFRTPVTVVQQFASLIQDGLAGEVSERQLEYLERIRVASRHIVRLFDDFRLSTRARLRAMPRVRARLKVSELLIGCAAEVGPDSVLVEVGAIDSPLAIYGDDEMLGIVLARLAGCALGRTTPGERVRLGITESTETHVEVHVSYRGKGPTDHEIEVFERGVLEDGLQRRSVTKVFGVGVELARTLLILGDGELRFERLGEDGGRIRARLPRYPGR